MSAVTCTRASPATTPVRVSPSTMMMSRPNRSMSASVMVSAAACAGPAVRITAANPAREAASSRAQAATPALAGSQAGAAGRSGQAAIPLADKRVRPRAFGAVAARGEQPQNGEHCEQHARGDGERCSAHAACLGDEGADRGEHEDLQQEGAAAAGVVVAVQFMMEAAIGPGDPDQREYRGELAESAPGQVPGKMVGVLGNQHDNG